MRRLTFAFTLLAVTASTGLAQKEFGFDNRKGSGQPYLKPDETVAKFKVPPEFEVKLFAGEPDLVNPIAFTIDEKGRVWCIECFEYPKRTPKGKAPRDRIVILEDTDGDGKCDKRTVFAEGKDFPVTPERAKAGLGAFDLASGIEVGHGGVFVGAPPYLWFIENKNDKPGKIDVLLKGFGSEDTHETLNTFQWGPDGWLYGLHGIFTNSAVKPGQLDGPEARINGGIWRYHPVKKTFEIFAEGTSNPWGMDWRNTDGQFILACCVIPHLYHIVPGGIYKRQAGASFHPHVYGYLNEICDHTFHKESGWAHAGLISLDVPHMPERFRNSVIFGSIHGCSVKQNILKPNGSTYVASRGEDFLVSGDKNFRPINMKWGPNGDIYLIDWHDQNPCHQTQADLWDYERGRVYRVQLKGRETKKAQDLGKLSLKELDALFASKDPYTWRTVLRLIGESKTEEKMRLPGPMMMSNFAQVLWSMNAKGVFAEKYLANLGVVPSEEVVKGFPADMGLMLRTLVDTGFLKENSIAYFAAIATYHPSPMVRRELASAAIRLADKHDTMPLLRALMSHKEDAKDPVIPQLVWLAYERELISTAPAQPGAPQPKDPPVADELNWLAEQSPKNEFVRDQIVPKVMRRLVATGKAADLKLCIDFVAKVKDGASRAKALEGLTVALQGRTVDMPEGWAALEKELRDDRTLLGYVGQLNLAFRDPVAIQKALAIAVDPGISRELRIEAIRQIALLKPNEGSGVLLDLIASEKVPHVRAEALRSVAAFDRPSVPTTILKVWKELPKELHGDAANTLASRKEWAKLLLAAMEKKTVDRQAVTDNTILRIQAFNDAELNKLIERAWGRSRPTPKELNDLIDKTRASLYEAPASFARGRAVFEATCAKCHRFEGKGSDVGPALDGAGRDIEYLLGNVLDPNRVIGAPYFVRIAKLLNGVVLTGVLFEEDEKFITLKIENGVLKKIAKEDLEEPVKAVEKSLMPEGLGYNMTAQDFRDLVRFTMANPFLTHVKINGEAKAFGVPGRIATPDTKGAPAVIEAEVTSPDEVKTTLLVGSTADFDVRLNGKPIGSGKGTGAKVAPDQISFEVTLPKGTHTLTIAAKQGNGVLFARLADPDRKLRYPDIGDKK